MLISMNFHKKSSDISIKRRSTPVSFLFEHQATNHTTVKWSIDIDDDMIVFIVIMTKVK